MGLAPQADCCRPAGLPTGTQGYYTTKTAAPVDDPLSLERIRDALIRAPAAVQAAPDGAVAAAVAVILRQRAGAAEVLLIRRAARDGDPWSGQMGLPGGHREPEDDGLLATAQRETREEVGVDLRVHGRLLGTLPAILARPQLRETPMTITPFVFEVSPEVEARSGDEVEEVLWTGVGPLARHERDTVFDFVRGVHTLRRPAWNVDGRVVWGLTYEMLTSLFALLPGSATPGGDSAALRR